MILGLSTHFAFVGVFMFVGVTSPLIITSHMYVQKKKYNEFKIWSYIDTYGVYFFSMTVLTSALLVPDNSEFFQVISMLALSCFKG